MKAKLVIALVIVYMLLLSCLAGYCIYIEQQKTLRAEWDRDAAVLTKDILILKMRRVCK